MDAIIITHSILHQILGAGSPAADPPLHQQIICHSRRLPIWHTIDASFASCQTYWTLVRIWGLALFEGCRPNALFFVHVTLSLNPSPRGRDLPSPSRALYLASCQTYWTSVQAWAQNNLQMTMYDCHWPEIIVLRRQIFGITLSWSANHAMVCRIWVL